MKNPKIQIKIALGLGKGRDRVLTCDLTKEYVAINGDYGRECNVRPAGLAVIVREGGRSSTPAPFKI